MIKEKGKERRTYTAYTDARAAAQKKKRAAASKQPTPPKLKILFTIVNRDKADVFAALLEAFDVNMQMIIAGHGTASTEMMRYLGLVDNEKSVIISVIREDRASAALKYLDNKFKTIKNGKGIAYTVPMSGTIGVAIYQFLSNSR